MNKKNDEYAGSYEYLNGLMGMKGWELHEARVVAVALEKNNIYRVRVNGPPEYENNILLRVKDLDLLLGTEDIEYFGSAHNFSAFKGRQELASLLRETEVKALYSPDKVLEGLWIQ